MPRKAIDYSKTIIYKIQHQDNEELVYVGHTTDFIKRKCAHKSNCNNAKSNRHNLKLYTMIRANGGWQCFKMVMIEEYPCANHLEACKREDECMRELKATMNSCGAVLDKEKQLEYTKKYYEANLEKLSEQHKQYREANKEQILEYKKQYYEANKEEINRKKRERYKAKKELKNKIS
jgi:uncharacterized hydantoinase/oxoprolinase family protein